MVKGRAKSNIVAWWSSLKITFMKQIISRKIAPNPFKEKGVRRKRWIQFFLPTSDKTTRNPTKLIPMLGAIIKRDVARENLASCDQPPPLKTLCSPVGGPSGSEAFFLRSCLCFVQNCSLKIQKAPLRVPSVSYSIVAC